MVFKEHCVKGKGKWYFDFTLRSVDKSNNIYLFIPPALQLHEADLMPCGIIYHSTLR